MRIGHTFWLGHLYKKIKRTGKADKGWKKGREIGSIP